MQNLNSSHTAPEWAGLSGQDEDPTIQGSNAWHTFRRKHIGASDVPIIMGTSPYKTCFGLWLEKTGQAPKEPTTWAQQRGTNAEKEILRLYHEARGVESLPAVQIYEAWPTLMASLDGLRPDGVIIECKYPSKKVYSACEAGKVPIYYYQQIQAQMLAKGSSEAHFVCYNGKEISIVVLKEDIQFQELILEKCKLFWECVVTKKSTVGVVEEIEYV